MSKYLLTLIPALAVVMFLTTGCESKPQPEDLRPVPEASLDPFGNGGMAGADGFGPGGAFDSAARNGEWGSSQDIAAATNADADGWVPADPENNLNMPVIYFAYDSDMLVPSETANLDKIAEYLGANQSLGLVIQGHCDQRGTEEYNRALGERRANAIRAYLAGRGVDDARMKTISFGKDKPAVDGSGESIWRQNRRGVPIPMIIPGR
jgi:peptidoglycan-associated lipoprotein